MKYRTLIFLKIRCCKICCLLQLWLALYGLVKSISLQNLQENIIFHEIDLKVELFSKLEAVLKMRWYNLWYKHQGTKIFQYWACPAGRVTYIIHSSCKHMHLSFKNVFNKEHKEAICNMTSWSYSSQSTCPVQSTRPTGRVLWEELLVLVRFHS